MSDMKTLPKAYSTGPKCIKSDKSKRNKDSFTVSHEGNQMSGDVYPGLLRYRNCSVFFGDFHDTVVICSCSKTEQSIQYERQVRNSDLWLVPLPLPRATDRKNAKLRTIHVLLLGLCMFIRNMHERLYAT